VVGLYKTIVQILDPVLHFLVPSSSVYPENHVASRQVLYDMSSDTFFLFCQDGYVPYHSARIELCPAASVDTSKKGQVFTEMLNNCLDQIRAPTFETRTFIRCDVNFDQSNQGRSLNTMIGRAAHIEFLETDIYAKFIMWSFPELFR
jgi:hypothetical protein